MVTYPLRLLVKVVTPGRGPRSYGFNAPEAITSDGSHIWETNGEGNSVTEFSASTGALVRVISGSNYGFSMPWGISSGDNHIWVTNLDGQSVTEFPAS